MNRADRRRQAAADRRTLAQNLRAFEKDAKSAIDARLAELGPGWIKRTVSAPFFRCCSSPTEPRRPTMFRRELLETRTLYLCTVVVCAGCNDEQSERFQNVQDRLGPIMGGAPPADDRTRSRDDVGEPS